MSAPSMTIREALGLGLTQALSLWRAALLFFLTQALGVLVDVMAPLLALALLFHSAEASLGAWVGGGVLWLGVQLTRWLVAGGALRQGRARMAQRPPGRVAQEVIAASPRALSFALATLPIDLLVSAWRWLALGTAGWSFVQALGSGEGGGRAAASLSLALTLSLPLGLLVSAWKRVGFVRAVSGDQGIWASLYESAGIFARRPGAYLAVVLVWGAVAGLGELMLAGMSNAVVSPNAADVPALSLSLGGQLVSGFLAAFIGAVAELAVLQSILALELSREGQLPARVESIPKAVLIADAELVPEPGGSAP